MDEMWQILKRAGFFSCCQNATERHDILTYATASVSGDSQHRAGFLAVLLLVHFGHSEGHARVSAGRCSNILQCFVGFCKGVDDISSLVTSAIAVFDPNWCRRTDRRDAMSLAFHLSGMAPAEVKSTVSCGLISSIFLEFQARKLRMSRDLLELKMWGLDKLDVGEHMQTLGRYPQ